MLFSSWLPSAANEFAGACIFCVALGMIDRLVRPSCSRALVNCERLALTGVSPSPQLAAFRGALEARWQFQ